MTLEQQSYEIYGTPQTLEEAWRFAELGARICYKSEKTNLTESSENFCKRVLLKYDDNIKNHLSCLEHGTIYLQEYFPKKAFGQARLSKYNSNKYSSYIVESDIIDGDLMGYYFYVTTNLRVLIENGWLDDLKLACKPTEYHKKRYTVKVTTDIGITREVNRHRTLSINESSTRYCNYMKEKFGMSITFIQPAWFNKKNLTLPWKGKLPKCIDSDGAECIPKLYYKGNENSKNPRFDIQSWSAEDFFIFAAQVSEFCYENLIRLGKKPQEARDVLLLSTKTEAIYTTFEDDWKHLFSLRTSIAASGAPHPQMVVLMDPIYKEFINKGFIKEIKL